MGITVEPVASRRALRRFIDLPRRLYAHTPQWVPFLDLDYRKLYRGDHPFFHHAEGEFLLACRDDTPVARVLMIRNDRYNRHHGTGAAHFYFADFIDEVSVANALFEAMHRWAHERGLTELLGPLFMGGSYGGGVLIEGFEHPAAMTMMPYNHSYYRAHYERLGFSKRFDLYSLFVDRDTFHLPERVEQAAEHVRRRGRMKVLEFSSRSALREIAYRVADLYNPTLADHEENYPLTDAELKYIIKELLMVARPDLEKVITYDDQVVGYMLGFPDLTPALRKNGGRITPAGIVRLIRAARRPRKLIINGMGILDRFQRLGGNALIYSELARTAHTSEAYDFELAEMVQINEHTDLMLSDMKKLGAQVAKIHRVYGKDIGG
jgi:hypothetical protein